MANPIGRLLSTARDDVGLTTTEIAKTTRIPAASILAMESGDFDVLPAPVFVRGFIRSYCREVDLDPTEVLGRYDAYIHEEERTAEFEEDGSNLGPLLLVGSDIGTQPSHRGLQISHMLLLLLALATFIIAYVTAGLPSSAADEAAVNDRADTIQQAAPDGIRPDANR